MENLEEMTSDVEIADSADSAESTTKTEAQKLGAIDNSFTVNLPSSGENAGGSAASSAYLESKKKSGEEIYSVTGVDSESGTMAMLESGPFETQVCTQASKKREMINKKRGEGNELKDTDPVTVEVNCPDADDLTLADIPRLEKIENKFARMTPPIHLVLLGIPANLKAELQKGGTSVEGYTGEEMKKAVPPPTTQGVTETKAEVKKAVDKPAPSAEQADIAV